MCILFPALTQIEKTLWSIERDLKHGFLLLQKTNIHGFLKTSFKNLADVKISKTTYFISLNFNISFHSMYI